MQYVTITKEELFALIENKAIILTIKTPYFHMISTVMDPTEYFGDILWGNNSLTLDFEHAKIQIIEKNVEILLPKTEMIIEFLEES